MHVLIYKIESMLSLLGRMVFYVASGLGDFSLFVFETARWTFKKPFRTRLFFRQMERIGVQSTLIIVLVGAFSGMVFALQIGSAFKVFNAESLVGSTVGIALARELAPVFTAIMIVARAGSAMAAELGTMQVTEQVDALRSMAVHPLQYLVVPKVIATTIMTPLLTGVFYFVGTMGSYLVAIYLLNISEGPYLYRYRYIVDSQDIYQGLIKACFFGFIVSLLACYKGYKTQNGAEGVGRSTTQAVVAGCVTILILDYFLSTWLLKVWPDF